MKDEVKVRDFVADLPLSDQNCAFNTMARQGKHRQCDSYSREDIGNYGFCKRHAAIIRKELGLATRVTTRGEGD